MLIYDKQSLVARLSWLQQKIELGFSVCTKTESESTAINLNLRLAFWIWEVNKLSLGLLPSLLSMGS